MQFRRLRTEMLTDEQTAAYDAIPRKPEDDLMAAHGHLLAPIPVHPEQKETPAPTEEPTEEPTATPEVTNPPIVKLMTFPFLNIKKRTMLPNATVRFKLYLRQYFSMHWLCLSTLLYHPLLSAHHLHWPKLQLPRLP